MKTLLAAALAIGITSPSYATNADVDYRLDLKACYRDHSRTRGHTIDPYTSRFELTYPNAFKEFVQCLELSRRLYKERKEEEQSR